jgi:hypothetical protein
MTHGQPGICRAQSPDPQSHLCRPGKQQPERPEGHACRRPSYRPAAVLPWQAYGGVICVAPQIKPVLQIVGSLVQPKQARQQ